MNLVKILRSAARIITVCFKILWGAYQLVLGILLLAIIWYSLKAFRYVHFFEIKSLKESPPASTSFMEAEKLEVLEDSVALKKIHERRKDPDDFSAIWWEWMELDSIPELLRELCIIAEDGKFYQHSGFDFEQIEYAIVANHQQGERARGASTISQQVIKNLYLSSDRTMTRKFREAAMTWLLEEHLEKDEILELYLNIAQFGPGVFGVGAGAKYHFDKALSELNLQETISLVALLPNPENWNPHGNSRGYRKHRTRIIRNLDLYKKVRRKIPDDVYEQFLKYSEEDEKARWSKLRSNSSYSGDSSSSSKAEPDSSSEKPGFLNRLKFWQKNKEEASAEQNSQADPNNP